MHTHHPLQVPAICSLWHLVHQPTFNFSVFNCSAGLRSLSYCTVAGFRPISLLQSYMVLLSLSALPVSISSLLVHSTTELVSSWTPAGVSKQIISIKRDRRPCSQFLYPGFNSYLDNTKLNLSRRGSTDEFFDLWGWCKNNLVNTREYKL